MAMSSIPQCSSPVAKSGTIGRRTAEWCVELEASGAVSDGTNTCLAASGFVVSAKCKAGPNVFATGTGRIGSAFGALGRTPAYLEGGASLGKTIEATSTIATSLIGHRRKPMLTMVASVPPWGWASSKRLRLHGR